MDSTTMIVIGIIASCVNYVIIYYVIKGAINNSRQEVESSQSIIDGQPDFVRILSALSKTAICPKNELMILSNINDLDFLKCIEFLEAQKYIITIGDKFFITESGLNWIQCFNKNEPNLQSYASQSIRVLEYIYENFSDKTFKVKDFKKVFQPENMLSDNLLFLAKRGFITIETEDSTSNKLNQYRINLKQDGHYLFN